MFLATASACLLLAGCKGNVVEKVGKSGVVGFRAAKSAKGIGPKGATPAETLEFLRERLKTLEKKTESFDKSISAITKLEVSSVAKEVEELEKGIYTHFKGIRKQLGPGIKMTRTINSAEEEMLKRVEVMQTQLLRLEDLAKASNQ